MAREVQQVLEEVEAEELQNQSFDSLIFVISMCSAMIQLAIGVSSMELTIKWNKIEGVHSLGSASQLIPFIIALGQFVNVAYLVLRKQGVFGQVQQIEEVFGEESEAGK